jgi:hypothetical protein
MIELASMLGMVWRGHLSALSGAHSSVTREDCVEENAFN